MNLRPHAIHLSLALVAALAVVSCKNNLDNKKLEGAITEGLKGKTTVKSVTCPADRPAKVGDKFDCDAVTGDGDKFAIKVEQTDDQGNVSWKADNIPAPKGAGDAPKPAADEHKADDDHK